MAIVRCLPRLSSTLSEIIYDTEGEDEDKRILPSLKDLCAKKLVSDQVLLPKNPEGLPQALQDVLMDAAVQYNRTPSVLHLLGTWKRETFKLNIPKKFRTWHIFCVQRRESVTRDRLSNLAGCAVLTVNHVVTMLYAKKNCHTAIRCLDFSDLPISDSLLRYVCNVFVNKLWKVDNPGCGSHEADDEMENNGDSQKVLVIKLNCVVNCRQTTARLCSAMIAAKEESSPVKLIVPALAITPEAYCDDAVTLLDLIDNEHLEVFNYEYCYLPDSERYKLYSRFKSFHNLRTLDMSYTMLDCRREPEFVHLLGKSLQMMPHLKQLYLNNCRITSCLHLIIGKKSRTEDDVVLPPASCGKLEYLALSGCGLSSLDLIFLCQSEHVETLRNLDLGDNTLDFSSLESLLVACENLVVLEVEECRFSEGRASIDQFFNLLSRLRNVRYLNIGGLHGINTEHVLTKAEHISQMASLKCLRLSRYIHEEEFLTIRSPSEVERDFICRMKQSLRKLWRDRKRRIKFLFC